MPESMAGDAHAENAVKASVAPPPISDLSKVTPPQVAAPKPERPAAAKRTGALLVANESLRALKNAAAADPSSHRGVTYTDDPIEAAGRGYVVAVAPRSASEIRDPTVVVEEAATVADGLKRFGVMSDEMVKNRLAAESVTGKSLNDARQRFLGK